MYHLANKELRIDVLDPISDSRHLGARFCWGAYIWQVHDLVAGPLLSGPEWPNPEPTPFNGQGLPESFRHRSLSGTPHTWEGAEGVALGAGTIREDTSGAIIVTDPCIWEVNTGAEELGFRTSHEAAGRRYTIERRLLLSERVLRSISRLTNTSTRKLTLEWFAHPFFALKNGVVQASLPPGSKLPPNPGFAINDGKLMQIRAFSGAKDGHMDRLELPEGTMLKATIAHPTLKHVSFSTDFAPASCVIWGNRSTFSFEPYLTLALAPGETKEWSLRYEFGVRAS